MAVLHPTLSVFALIFRPIVFGDLESNLKQLPVRQAIIKTLNVKLREPFTTDSERLRHTAMTLQ
jgi:hypothetical protein